MGKLKLTKEEAARLSALTAGRGKRKGLYNDPRKYSITQKEYDNIKRLYKQGLCKYRIVRELDISYYKVNSTLNGKFDVLFKP